MWLKYISDFEDYEEVGPFAGIPQAPKIDLPICSRIDESWCESAKPDCSTSTARKSCPKYCELCQGYKTPITFIPPWKTKKI